MAKDEARTVAATLAARDDEASTKRLVKKQNGRSNKQRSESESRRVRRSDERITQSSFSAIYHAVGCKRSAAHGVRLKHRDHNKLNHTLLSIFPPPQPRRLAYRYHEVAFERKAMLIALEVAHPIILYPLYTLHSIYNTVTLYSRSASAASRSRSSSSAWHFHYRSFVSTFTAGG